MKLLSSPTELQSGIRKVCLAIGMFDGDVTASESLREFLEQKRVQFGHAHFCKCHINPPALASRRLLH